MLFNMNHEWHYDGNFEEDAAAVVGPRALVALAAVGKLLQDKIRERLDQAGSGRYYYSRGSKGRHQASAPGEPPAPDKGDYRDSWVFEVSSTATSFVVGLSSSLWTKFGRRLELGGYGGGAYIAPRPHIRSVLDENEGAIQQVFDQM